MKFSGKENLFCNLKSIKNVSLITDIDINVTKTNGTVSDETSIKGIKISHGFHVRNE